MSKIKVNKSPDILIQSLIKKLTPSPGNKLKKIDSIKDFELKKKELLKFLYEIYPDSKKATLTIIKELFLSLASTETIDELIINISQFLNHPAQSIRYTTLDIIYDLYYDKFIPSKKISQKLTLNLIDCLAVSELLSPDTDLDKGYYLLILLGNKYPEESLILLYKALKDKSHPCRIKFMEIFGEIYFESSIWLEKLTPYIMDFLSGEDEIEILIALSTIKKLFSYYPELLGRFIRPVLNLLYREEETIQIETAWLVEEISLLNIGILIEPIEILIDFIKDQKRSQEATIIIGRALSNLKSCKDGDIKNTISKIIKKSDKINYKTQISDIINKNTIWTKTAVNILYQGMINQQTFSIKEIIWLLGEDIFKEVISKLILKLHSSHGSFLGIYNNKNWLTAEGKIKFAQTNQIFTIAHPLDIFFANQITLWQKIIMEQKIKQPFQQVFRSLYSLHMDEITSIESLRFSRHKLITDKAIAAFQEEGFIIKDMGAFYNWKDAHIQCCFIWDSKNSSDKGLTITGAIKFHKIIDLKTNIIDKKRIPLWQIDPRIFSETIRKLEIVISRSIFRKSLY